ncbi:Glutamyl-tRNA(Gln) amidotransferase subunit A [uncultured Eubacteriales bacterium]|uniref:Glutamyl-tRNA(Gln) amidotransferase subunit A n=1 Tax=uncultured Eubacteriales bacterium TaxID=172733 RepID=A0A212K6Q0_9FIRM|nr:Glutamyl-tRNA(Gln) amidotransferase subunit A [uncultured Eubacteriales bacterium]
MTDLRRLSALELGQLLADCKLSLVDIQNTAANDTLNAFITRVPFPTAPMEGTSPLAGVPMAYKDNICTKDLPTTCGSKLLADFLPAYDATVVERLAAAGAVSLGKLNMDEFAMGSSGETSYFGPTKNPWDPARSPGGSSGGSAAAVAVRQVWYALGTDTGGSVRQPAAYCGVTGLKPSYGRVSRYGLVAHASSLDQIGPIAPTAADCAAVLDLISGNDPRDATSLDLPPIGTLSGDLRGRRIGLPVECFTEAVDVEVAAAVMEAAQVLKARGAKMEQCSIPELRHAAAAYYVLSSAEASSNLARFSGPRYPSRTEGFGSEVKRRIMLGTFVLSAEGYEDYYREAQRTREALCHAFAAAFERYDLLLTPTTPTTAPLLGLTSEECRSCDLYTVPANLAGLPALSMPCGFDGHGLPVGAQLMGPALGDDLVLSAAHGYQLETTWHRNIPEGGGAL